ncbi:MAG TPA: HAD-IA family hydrolase, partial [Phytomonospora sp.]
DDAGARAAQADLCRRYGTTLRGLMTTRGIDAAVFLAAEHDIDYSVVAPDPRLTEASAALPGRVLVYTNGPAAHAARVLDLLDLSGIVEGVFDLEAAALVPKPDPGAFGDFVARFAVEAAEAAMFDDLAHNLAPAREAGMTVGHVDWSAAGGPVAEVVEPSSLRVRDLTGLLEGVGSRLRPA